MARLADLSLVGLCPEPYDAPIARSSCRGSTASTGPGPTWTMMPRLARRASTRSSPAASASISLEGDIMNRTQAICAETSRYHHRQAVCGAPRGPACAVTRRPPSRIDPLRLTRPCAASRIWFSRPQGLPAPTRLTLTTVATLPIRSERLMPSIKGCPCSPCGITQGCSLHAPDERRVSSELRRAIRERHHPGYITEPEARQ